MKPYPLRLVRVDTLIAAYEALESYGPEGRILAGGQSLMPILNFRLAQPEVLIDINPVVELQGISEEDGHVRIGAMTRHRDVADSPVVALHLPLLAQAMPLIAHQAVRNRGTFGGSLCLADPAAELPACMLALKAEMIVGSREGQRLVAAEDFFLGLFETDIGEGEILLGARIPMAGPATRSAIDEVARRHGDYAIVGACACAEIAASRFRNVRLVFFGVEDRPILALAASAALEGNELDDGSRSAALAALEGGLSPNDDHQASSGMRLHLARVLTERILTRLATADGERA